ncbi:MAG: DNA-processing protein DprA [Bacteroidetes bacterium]|nr:DNA-processing protein DprA [Bacteroidota bacterium]
MSPEGISQELYYQIALSLVPGVGPVMAKSLIGYCGGAEAVFTEKKSRLAKIPYVGKTSVDSITAFHDFEMVDQEIQFIERSGIRAIPFGSNDYPLRLRQEMDSPLVLYSKGNTNLNHHRIVGIVGTRKNTFQGAEITRKIVEGLKKYDVIIASGLAYGIDICAHKACLEFDIPTIGVVAHGLDILYPGHHKAYAKKMVETGGAVLSEHISGTALNPDLFPRRNRIVAALCDCIIVIESKGSGGSMITAEIASGYNRDVFAVPGRPTDLMSEGCNALIKNLKAALCESAEDIAHGMNWDLPEKFNTVPRQTEMFMELNAEEKKVMDILIQKETCFDDIFLETQIPVSKLSFILLDMEMRGLLRSMPGKKYAKG